MVPVHERAEDRPVLERQEEAVDALRAHRGLKEGDGGEDEAEKRHQTAKAPASRPLLEYGRRHQVQDEERGDEGEAAPRVGYRRRQGVSGGKEGRELDDHPEEKRQSRPEERRRTEEAASQVEAPTLLVLGRRIDDQPASGEMEGHEAGAQRALQRSRRQRAHDEHQPGDEAGAPQGHVGPGVDGADRRHRAGHDQPYERLQHPGRRAQASRPRHRHLFGDSARVGGGTIPHRQDVTGWGCWARFRS